LLWGWRLVKEGDGLGMDMVSEDGDGLGERDGLGEDGLREGDKIGK